MSPEENRKSLATKRTHRIGPVAFVIVALAGLALLAPLFRGKRPELSPVSSLEPIQWQLRDELPIGSTRYDIEAWAVQHDYRFRFQSFDLTKLPAPPTKMLQEVSGLPRESMKSFAELVTDWGTYKLWRTGETAGNKLWVYLPVDEEGRVAGHYCLTLEQLAEHERRRELAREIDEANGVGDK